MIFSIRMYLLKEKTGKSLEVPNKGDHTDSNTRGSSLVLSIDKTGRITKFNKECERISGYTKKEVLNRYIFDFLIPTRYFDQWKNLFDYSPENKVIEDYKLPLLTKRGTEIMICWSNFHVKNTKGVVVDISLVGNLVNSLDETDEKLHKYPEYETKGFTIESLIKNKKIISHDDSDETIGDVEQINAVLERKNVALENNLQALKARRDQFAGKKRKQKFQTYDDKMRELEEHENILNKLESKLTEDKIKINGQVNKFKKWREKLESLENQLENKREGLLKLERSPIKQARDTSYTTTFKVKKDEEVEEHRNLLDEIPDCAAIVQRGILKQANDSFANLVGYDLGEIVDKRLSDFIAPEGFSDVEKYYLSRLKGVDAFGYETVFLTKDNNKISVEVSTKPAFFNGLKAEIAVFKKLENKKNE